MEHRHRISGSTGHKAGEHPGQDGRLSQSTYTITPIGVSRQGDRGSQWELPQGREKLHKHRAELKPPTCEAYSKRTAPESPHCSYKAMPSGS